MDNQDRPASDRRETENKENKQHSSSSSSSSSSNHTQHVYNHARPMRPSRSHTYHPYKKHQPKPHQQQQQQKHTFGSKRKGDILGTAIQRQILNWMKRFLLQKYVKHNFSVLDLCAGRGQDLYKYHHQRVKRLVMIDVAENELHLARQAYEEEQEFKTTLGQDQPPIFIPSDLRMNVITIRPQVDVVCCQLGLHYLWGSSLHINHFFSTVTSSLLPKGFLLLTILDADKIPTQGLTTHPYLWFSPIYNVETKNEKETEKGNENKTVRKAYKFTYKGRIEEPVEEFVIPRSELLSECKNHSLKWIQDYNIDNVQDAVFAYHTHKENPLQISENDWYALRMYRCYAFQYCPQ